MTNQIEYDVLVIGGGSAGLMAAGRAGELGKRVLLLEKNPELGKKLSISGGGRCNITNAEEDVHALLAHYGDASKALHSPFSQFGMSDTFAFFTSRGLPLKIEERKRAFPVTEKASDVVRVLTEYTRQHHVAIRTHTEVEKILTEHGHITGVVCNGATLRATSYILATGGMSHPETGSTGDGFDWLRELGHTVHTPTPSLVPLAVSDAWVQRLSGVALDGVKITFFVDTRKRFAVKGRILFTHFGISGPLILNTSKRVADLLHEGDVTAELDLFPSTTIGDLDKQILATFNEHKNKDFGNVFPYLVPQGSAKSLLRLMHIQPETKVHSVGKEQRKAMSHTLKALPMRISGLMGFDRAIVADGGVDIGEVDCKTMRSRKLKNLYIAGDLLHINRPSGGYSLQLCWTTGYVAGTHAAEVA